MEWLLRDAYCEVGLDRAQRLVRLARTSTAYPTLQAYDAEVSTLLSALAPFDRAPLGLLVDLRHAPMRNDLGSEAVATRFRRDVLHGFARVAVLVATQVGKLQIARHAHTDHVSPHTFLNEADALAFLTANLDSSG